MTTPEKGQKWVSKKDETKVATIIWVNTADYVCFHAWWYKRLSPVESLSTFNKRFKLIT